MPSPAREERSASWLDAIDEGILIVDGDGGVHVQNVEAVRILGRRVATLADAFGPWELEPPRDDRTAAYSTELELVEQPDRWLRVTHHPPDEARNDEVVVIDDVTEVRRRRGLRDAFLSLLSHELRTPVTSIHAAAELLDLDTDALDVDEQRGLVVDIAEEAQRLLGLVDDLLVLAHFEEGLELVQEPSLLQHVVPAAVERERQRRSGVELIVDVRPGLPVVVGDVTSVQQVVRNLISNACKYGAGAPVEIEIRAEDESGAAVHVRDRGPGLKPEEAEALFRPFFRSSKTAGAKAGAGIGLYVCRRLVEAMGGHIWARRRDGGGSDFGFWLPAYEMPPDDERPADGARRSDAAASHDRPRGDAD